MGEFFSTLSLFALVLTIGAFQVGQWCQKKWRSPICNPVLIAVILIMGVLLVTGIDPENYQQGTQSISWLLTPATVCLALPLYEQMRILKKNLPAILAGVVAGTVTSLLTVALLCWTFSLSRELSISLLPKSITTAMGIVLSQQSGGIPALTTVVIIVTGILGSLIGPGLCRLLKLKDPICQGVALGTASHVIGTSKANELGALQGAVSSLSLTCAGILTAIVFPLACMLL